MLKLLVLIFSFSGARADEAKPTDTTPPAREAKFTGNFLDELSLLRWSPNIAGNSKKYCPPKLSPKFDGNKLVMVGEPHNVMVYLTPPKTEKFGDCHVSTKNISKQLTDRMLSITSEQTKSCPGQAKLVTTYTLLISPVSKNDPSYNVQYSVKPHPQAGTDIDCRYAGRSIL